MKKDARSLRREIRESHQRKWRNRLRRRSRPIKHASRDSGLIEENQEKGER